MSAENIFYCLVKPMIFMIACLMIGYNFATNNADVCKIQIEKAKKSLHYESLLNSKSESKDVEIVTPKETDEVR